MTTEAPTFTASTTDFLLNTGNAANVGSDTFILQINGFSENGVAVPVPGLGTNYGLYIEGTVAVQGSGTASVYGPGTISLVLDPTNNDGTPAAVWDPTTQTGLVGFSNPENTLDDITLATGNFVSGSFGPQSNGQNGANFVQTFDLNPQVFGPLLSHLASSLAINETLFNTATSRMTGTITAGGNWVTSNDGFGIVSLTTASVVGDSRPTFLGPDNTEGGARAGALGGSAALDLRALAGSAIGADFLAALGIKVPGSSPSKGCAMLQDPWPGMASGALPHPDQGGGWTAHFGSHGQ
jgi:hypothetical protein